MDILHEITKQDRGNILEDFQHQEITSYKKKSQQSNGIHWRNVQSNSKDYKGYIVGPNQKTCMLTLFPIQPIRRLVC